jgi:hypothetical protein
MTDYSFTVAASDAAAANRHAESLSDLLRGVDGVLSVARTKPDVDSMDVGTVVGLIAESAATLAIARGISAWLKSRNGVDIFIRRRGKSESLKTVITGLDPDSAARIVNTILGEASGPQDEA